MFSRESCEFSGLCDFHSFQDSSRIHTQLIRFDFCGVFMLATTDVLCSRAIRGVHDGDIRQAS